MNQIAVGSQEDQNVFFSTQYLPTCINSESVSFCICMLLKYSLNNNSAIKSF